MAVQPRDDGGPVGGECVQSFRSVLSSMLRWLQGRPGYSCQEVVGPGKRSLVSVGPGSAGVFARNQTSIFLSELSWFSSVRGIFPA